MSILNGVLAGSSARAAALEKTRTAGWVSTLSPERRAAFFECDVADAADYFENLSQNAYALCVGAGVSEEEMNTAYTEGYAEGRKAKGE